MALSCQPSQMSQASSGPGVHESIESASNGPSRLPCRRPRWPWRGHQGDYRRRELRDWSPSPLRPLRKGEAATGCRPLTGQSTSSQFAKCPGMRRTMTAALGERIRKECVTRGPRRRKSARKSRPSRNFAMSLTSTGQEPGESISLKTSSGVAFASSSTSSHRIDRLYLAGPK